MDDAATPQAPADEPLTSVDAVTDKVVGLMDAMEADPDPDETEAAEAKDPEDAESPEESEEESEGEDEPAEDDDPSVPDGEAPEGEPELYEVKVNGETQKVALDELQNGYSRLEDYKAKTAALSEEKRQFSEQSAAEWQRLQEMGQALSIGYEQDPVLEAWRNADKQELLEYDQDQYHRLRNDAEERERWYQEVFQTHHYVQQEAEQRAQAQQQEVANREAQALVEKYPT